MPHPNEVGGFKLPTADEVLADVAYGRLITCQADADEAMKIDHIRGHILEKIGSIKEMIALRKRYFASAEKCRHRLEFDPELTAHYDRQEVEGLMELEIARAENCRAMIEHFAISIQTLYAMLG